MERDDDRGNEGPRHRTYPPPVSPATKDYDNRWLLEENLLSSCYSLGSGGDHHRTTAPYGARRIVPPHANVVVVDDVGNGNDGRSLRGCPNMASGIHCLHPNALTSYARSSAFMR
jgi:hypothetical protein